MKILITISIALNIIVLVVIYSTIQYVNESFKLVDETMQIIVDIQLQVQELLIPFQIPKFTENVNYQI